MSTDPAQLRAEITALLAALPDLDMDIDGDALAERFAAAHDVLVRALESVEQG